LEEVVQANQLKIAELTKEIAILKEKQPPSKQVNNFGLNTHKADVL
jgi:hypothetical protein